MTFCKRKKAGTAFFVVIGVLSLLTIIVVFLFYATRSRVNITGLHDQNKVARYFLESYVGDVLLQLRRAANDKESQLYSRFRALLNEPKTIKLDCEFYNKSELLKFIETNPYGMLHASHTLFEPEVILFPPEPLLLPDMFDVSQYKGVEFVSRLTISGAIKLNNKKYRLKVEYPFKVVSRLLPMVREFVFFADQLHLEQPDAFENDKINLVRIEAGEVAPGSGYPLVIGPNAPEEDTDAIGKIFMGADKQPVYLNVGGEKIFRSGQMNDLWQITPTFLEPVKADTPEFISHLLALYSGRYFRTVKAPITREKMAYLYVLGFSRENIDPVNGHFVDTSLSFEGLFDGVPAFARLKRATSDKVFTSAAAIKPYGIKPEKEDYYLGPNRRLYGDVFNRFFLFARFEWYDKGLKRADLPYESPPAGVPFEPQPGTAYEQYMTRIISSGMDYDHNRDVPDDYCAANRNEKVEAERIRAADFVGVDKLKLRGSFIDFATDFLLTNLTARQRPANADKTIWQRVAYEFPSQDEFKRFVGLQKNEFCVDGICYIKGDLDLSAGIAADKISGGIVLVDGDIVLGNIDHGLDFSDSNFIEESAINFAAEKVLTFVALGKNSQIRLKGNHYMGVQLVNLQNSLDNVTQQIVFEPPSEECMIFGSIVVSTPDLQSLTEVFEKKSPYLRFIPSMASAVPPAAVQIDLTPENYSLFIDD